MTEDLIVLQYAKRFYFIEYYALLLGAINKYSIVSQAQKEFIYQKNSHYLGLSRYRKISSNNEDGTLLKSKDKYEYTFSQVLLECKNFNLVEENKQLKNLSLTIDGEKLLEAYRTNKTQYKEILLQLMERKYTAFSYLLDKIYKISPKKSGLIIFPNYSPNDLGFTKSEFLTVETVHQYIEKYEQRIVDDIKKYINQNYEVTNETLELITELKDKGYISDKLSDEFNLKKYNAVVRKTQVFWRNRLLKFYGISSRWQSFEIWIYRAKQLGILNTTPFYPDFLGQIIYPVAIITKKEFLNNTNYKLVMNYKNEKFLYKRNVQWETIENDFFNELWNVYSELKKRNRINFLSLHNIKEIVCYNLKISYEQFSEFLNIAYEKSLNGNTSYSISLEADKLPEETNAIYIKREPIFVNGKNRNIISLSYKGKDNEQIHK